MQSILYANKPGERKVLAAAQPDIEPDAQKQPAPSEWLARAESLKNLLREGGDRIEAERELPSDILSAIHEVGLFRMSLPYQLGGGQLPVPILAQATQTIASADASTGWCLGQGLGCAMSSAFLDPSIATEVFAAPNSVLAWGAGVQGTAQIVDGGYRVSGTWRFASGGKHATWLGGHSWVVDANGEPLSKQGGKRVDRTMVFPREQATILDDWHVMGLKGTRSEGYTVEGLFVPEAYSLDRDNPEECHLDATLYKFPTTNVYASMFSGVALGIARSMFDDLIELSQTKTARAATTSMRESPVLHTRLAELEAQWSSAQAFQQQTLKEVWAEVDASGEITLSQRARIRLCTTYAINQATEVAEQVYRLAGSSAVFENGVFERRFRDIHAVSQQVQARHTNFETVGRHMLGLDVDVMFM